MITMLIIVICISAEADYSIVSLVYCEQGFSPGNPEMLLFAIFMFSSMLLPVMPVAQR